jgi:hydroxypyruvate isomerase
MTRTLPLAVCAGTLWPEKPFDWRLKRLSERGFEGNLIEWRRKRLPWIGEAQVADVRGRKEPGAGKTTPRPEEPSIAWRLEGRGRARGPRWAAC